MPEEQTPYQQTKSAFLFFVGILIIFPLALILDIAGFILFFVSLAGPAAPVGIIISFIVDIIGIICIGLWMFFNSGTIAVPERTKKRITQIGKQALKEISKTTVKQTSKTAGKFFLKFGLTSLGELIPYLGDLMPFWTLTVLSELIKTR